MKAKWKRYIAQKFRPLFNGKTIVNRSARIIIPNGKLYDIYHVSYNKYHEVYDDIYGDSHDFGEVIEFSAVFEDFDAIDEDNPNPYFSVANHPAEFLYYLFRAYSIESLVKMRIEVRDPLTNQNWIIN